MNKALNFTEMTKAIGRAQGGFYPGGLCPTCQDVFGGHSGNCCRPSLHENSLHAEQSEKFWPIEDLLRIEKEKGNIYKLDEIFGFLFFKRADK